jgi:hypothetical protein
MISYLERYQEISSRNHNNSRIWAELLSLGSDIRKEPLAHDVKAVVAEAMKRARINIETLVERLNILQYHFLEPKNIWMAPNHESLRTLNALEERYGDMPLSLHMWYEIVGSVNFMGTHPKLGFIDGIEKSKFVSAYSDPIVINPLWNNPNSFYLDLIYEDTGEEITDPPYSILLAPDKIQKANQSGGGPTQIMFPNLSIDAPLISEDWDNILFINYLQICFQWGGFPGWREQQEYPKEEIAFLTKDLLAI